MYADVPEECPYPEERALVASAVSKRVQEFTTGRHCARRALARLGVPAGPILRGAWGAPAWPDRIRGSITHCTGYRAAAVAEASSVAAIGIDAEPHAALPPGMLRMISDAPEAAHVRGLLLDRPGTRWDRLVFSAKESTFKALQPPPSWPTGVGAQKDVDFRDIVVSFEADSSVFTARVAGAEPAARRNVAGRWTTGAGLVVTAVVVPAEPGVLARDVHATYH
ncbi:4'-phosphopantetheinyl transferase [Streptomyces sp. NPDC058861]|uniref:4'-phosphopantetheinyl transferase family protein n=1 Tax=Streptomyces sp. NPDC058861 TaxID=3346653 RepID=UPI00369763C7